MRNGLLVNNRISRSPGWKRNPTPSKTAPRELSAGLYPQIRRHTLRREDDPALLLCLSRVSPSPALDRPPPDCPALRVSASNTLENPEGVDNAIDSSSKRVTLFRPGHAGIDPRIIKPVPERGSNTAASGPQPQSRNLPPRKYSGDRRLISFNKTVARCFAQPLTRKVKIQHSTHNSALNDYNT